jgi:hypothetical protein
MEPWYRAPIKPHLAKRQCQHQAKSGEFHKIVATDSACSFIWSVAKNNVAMVNDDLQQFPAKQACRRWHAGERGKVAVKPVAKYFRQKFRAVTLIL